MNGNANNPAQDSGIEKIFRALDEYRDNKDRWYPPVFVGRRDEMDSLRRAVKAVASKGVSGQTRVVQGVPGAGKTSLLTHFAKEVGGDIIEGGKTVCVVQMLGDDLSARPIDLVTRLSVNAAKQRSWAAKALRAGAEANAQTRAGRSGFDVLNAHHGLNERSSLTECLDIYSRYIWPDNVCVVVAVDEMQTCPVTRDTRSNLISLHNQASAYHVLTVCFGLSNTLDVLDEAGLSRLADACVEELGTLAPGEGREVLEKTLVHLGVDWGDTDWRDYVEGLGFTKSSWAAWRDALVERLDEETPSPLPGAAGTPS